jgi:uncharacterized protein
MRLLAGAVGAAVVSAALTAGAQTPPPPPQLYFNDYAGLVSATDAARLNEKLARFDQESSNQILVVIYPELPSPSMEDFTVRAAQAWKVGRGKLDNGAVLFVFLKDRKMRIEVGYGLEGALPDATAKRIIDDQIAPAFRASQPARGLEAGIDAIVAVTRGEYKAEQRAARSGRSSGGASLLVLLVLLVPLFVLSQFLARRGPASFDSAGFDQTQVPWGMGSGYQRRRRRRRSSYWGGGGGGWGGGGGGGFGGFSGGGGSFGGGGASGSW